MTPSPTANFKQVLLNTSHLNNATDTVNWIDVSAGYSVTSVQNHVSVFLDKFARSNGFLVTPTRTVSFVTGSCPSLAQKVPFYHYKQLVFDTTTPNGTPCVVRLCPFNLTNSLVFASYVAHGSLTTRLPNSIGYLSDIKYLENMVGGVIQTKNCDIGLVAQHLRKLNGDGDLVVVLLWKEVLQAVEISDTSSPTVSSARRTTYPVSVAASHLQEKFPVFPVRTVLGSDGRSSWGSCVLFKNDLLVTNTHVLAPYIEDPVGTAVILDLPDGPLTILLLKHTVETPSSLIDISTISLTESDTLRIMRLGYQPAKKGSNPTTGQHVASVGYGLFLPPQWQTPGVSQGTLDLVFNTRYHHHALFHLPSLLITSASCWNGSSGGGLFRNDELLGIVCSNAEVRVDGRPLDDGQNAPVEKLTRFVFVVPVDLVDYLINDGLIESDGPLEKTWRLEAFHEDRILNESKL